MSQVCYDGRIKRILNLHMHGICARLGSYCTVRSEGIYHELYKPLQRPPMVGDLGHCQRVRRRGYTCGLAELPGGSPRWRRVRHLRDGGVSGTFCHARCMMHIETGHLGSHMAVLSVPGGAV